MRKRIFLKQIKSKQPIMGTLVITLMLLATAIFFIGIVPEQAEAAYTDYVHCKQITIESDYIATTLTSFPILVHDNTGDLLGEVLANGSDIAFFNVTNETQYNHEIEMYNSTTGELWAWVNVTSVSSSVDTIFYMYYKDSDGGYSIGHNPTDVWDVNYSAVWHMNDVGGATVYDATSNDIDLVNSNSGCDANYTGKVGTCFLWVNANGDFMYHDTFWNIFPAAVTAEIWFNLAIDTFSDLISKRQNDADNRIMLVDGNSTIANSISCRAGGGANDPITILNDFVATDTWYYNAYTYADSAVVTLWDNDSEQTSANPTGTMADGAGYDFSIGTRSDAEMIYKFDGRIDEVRISNAVRNDSWINASFHSQNETTGFLTLGSQQGESSSIYTLKGLTSSRITFAGTAGTTVWCNSSGDGNEWLEINMSINATDNVTEIRVFVDDLNNSVDINASNISMFVSNAANVTYYSFGSFLDGGSNITINQSTWNTKAWQLTNPFNGTGLKDINTSIFLIFSLDIPATAPTDIFWSVATDSYKVYIGYYT